MSNSKDNKSTTTLYGILRLKINQAHGNKFWLVNKWKDICIDGDANNELLSDREIVHGIQSGNIEIDRRLKEDEILINESEFFRIVEHLNPYCVVDDGRGYKWIRYNGSNVKTKIWWEFNEPDISKSFCYATHVVKAE